MSLGEPGTCQSLFLVPKCASCVLAEQQTVRRLRAHPVDDGKSIKRRRSQRTWHVSHRRLAPNREPS